MTDSKTHTPTTTRGDLILELPHTENTARPETTVDTRLRLGYPRQPQDGQTTRSDLVLSQAVTAGVAAARLPTYDETGRPIAPLGSDPHADAKRTLAYTPATGLAALTGGQVSLYTGHGLDARVADGSVRLAAVDQNFAPEAAKQAGLSYLRLGAPEPALTGADGKPLTRPDDQMMDQKYTSGIGLFSDGGLTAWARKSISLRSTEGVYLTTPAYSLSSYGESKIISYELNEDSDIEKVNSGAFADTGVDRRIINVNWLRPTPIGWYRQIFDRGRTLAYSTSNKGDFSTGASYGMGIGAKFEHSISVGLGTSFAGKVEVNKGFSVEIGATGATFKHPFGSWTQEADAELSGLVSVKLGVSGLDTIPITSAMTTFSALLHASVAAQTLAFTAYNAVLAGQADRTLTAADTANKGDDTHGLLTALEEGIKIYEAALSLSAITCAAGIVMGAVQAGWQAARVADPLAPSIELTRTGITLKCGISCISIGPTGIDILATPGAVRIGGMSIEMMAPVIDHKPFPPPPPLPV